MKTRVLILLAGLLLGCVSQPNQYVSVLHGEDYYRGGAGSAVRYYDPGFTSLTGIGLYPWWSAGQTYWGSIGRPPAYFGFNNRGFSHYSPWFYPHYFSVWYPPRYDPFHGWYGGYYPGWCPPYRNYRGHAWAGGASETPVDPTLGKSVVTSPVPPGFIYRRPYELERGDLHRTAGGVRSGAPSHRLYGAMPAAGVGTDSAAVGRGDRRYNAAPPSSASRSISSITASPPRVRASQGMRASGDRHDN